MLICDGSHSYAARLRRVLEHDGDITVAAVCATAEEAIAALPRVQPDVVTMDVELPGMDGLAAIEEIMSRRPLPILVISVDAGNASREAAAAALGAGAVAGGQQERAGPGRPGRGRGGRVQTGPGCAAPRRSSATRGPGSGTRRCRAAPGAPHVGDRRVRITGGPYVLFRLLGVLPADYAIPILLVQHMAGVHRRARPLA